MKEKIKMKKRVGVGLDRPAKKQTGITLIALIITIIIMLILVAVSINILIQSNIIGSAKTAADATKDAIDKESELSKIEVDGKKYASIQDYIDGNEMLCDHEFGEIITVEATCEEAGKTSKTCKLCGYEEIISETEALGHNFENGICTRCNKYEIQYTLTHLIEPRVHAIAANSTETIAIAAETGYDLPNNITVSGATINWNKETGTLEISNPTGKVSITAEGTVGVSPYIGCYVDLDEATEGPEGIIFADLAYPTSGTYWNITYSYPAQDVTFKTYKTTGTKVSKFAFEENDVIEIENNTGEPRFYVMALDDVDTAKHYWYYRAYSEGMSDYSTYTSTSFGKGPENTTKMLAKWNEEVYGTRATTENPINGKTDMWGLIPDGWFVPSKDEWVAFAKTFSITTSNYDDLGLRNSFWSSSQNTTNYAWEAYFNYADMCNSIVCNDKYVRLCTTF